jgi:hypothetical protein
MLIMLQAGLRCVDVNGCLREHCSAGYTEYLRKDYKYILLDSMANNPKCRTNKIKP